jgi:hypothetical protein
MHIEQKWSSVRGPRAETRLTVYRSLYMLRPHHPQSLAASDSSLSIRCFVCMHCLFLSVLHDGGLGCSEFDPRTNCRSTFQEHKTTCQASGKQSTCPDGPWDSRTPTEFWIRGVGSRCGRRRITRAMGSWSAWQKKQRAPRRQEPGDFRWKTQG